LELGCVLRGSCGVITCKEGVFRAAIVVIVILILLLLVVVVVVLFFL